MNVFYWQWCFCYWPFIIIIPLVRMKFHRQLFPQICYGTSTRMEIFSNHYNLTSSSWWSTIIYPIYTYIHNMQFLLPLFINIQLHFSNSLTWVVLGPSFWWTRSFQGTPHRKNFLFFSRISFHIEYHFTIYIPFSVTLFVN